MIPGSKGDAFHACMKKYGFGRVLGRENKGEDWDDQNKRTK